MAGKLQRWGQNTSQLSVSNDTESVPPLLTHGLVNVAFVTVYSTAYTSNTSSERSKLGLSGYAGARFCRGGALAHLYALKA